MQLRRLHYIIHFMIRNNENQEMNNILTFEEQEVFSTSSLLCTKNKTEKVFFNFDTRSEQTQSSSIVS